VLSSGHFVLVWVLENAKQVSAGLVLKNFPKTYICGISRQCDLNGMNKHLGIGTVAQSGRALAYLQPASHSSIPKLRI
jgi:hypothetical protein